MKKTHGTNKDIVCKDRWWKILSTNLEETKTH